MTEENNFFYFCVKKTFIGDFFFYLCIAKMMVYHFFLNMKFY